MKITPQMVRENNACYDPVVPNGQPVGFELFKETDSIELIDLMDVCTIPQIDRVWLFTTFAELEDVVLFAGMCAESADEHARAAARAASYAASAARAAARAASYAASYAASAAASYTEFEFQMWLIAVILSEKAGGKQ